MEIYKETGKLKTGELRVTRPIGAFILGMTQNFGAITGETMTAFVERANGNNSDIATDIHLGAIIALSTAGSSAITERENYLQAYCEICEEGAIDLKENEAIKVKLDGLKAGVEYSIHGLELPVLSPSVVKIDKKNILSGESQKRYDVQGYEMMVLTGVDSIIEMNVRFSNGFTCKYTPEELRAISRDFDPTKSVNESGSSQFDLANFITYPLVEVVEIDIKKQTGEGKEVTLYVKNDVEKF